MSQIYSKVINILRRMETAIECVLVSHFVFKSQKNYIKSSISWNTSHCKVSLMFIKIFIISLILKVIKIVQWFHRTKWPLHTWKPARNIQIWTNLSKKKISFICLSFKKYKFLKKSLFYVKLSYHFNWYITFKIKFVCAIINCFDNIVGVISRIPGM